MGEVTCSTCRFWKTFFPAGAAGRELYEAAVNDGRAAGDCHRYPPPTTQEVDSPDESPDPFPRTAADDFCGEYQPRKDVTPGGVRRVGPGREFRT